MTTRKSMTYPQIRLDDYDYTLPEDKIARFPLPQRDQAKLLVYAQGSIRDHGFGELPGLLPPDSSLFFNNTKVIAARLSFAKESTPQAPGALIEIFLLQPVAPSPVVSLAMLTTQFCIWQCTIGRLKRWKPGTVLRKTIQIKEQAVSLTARLTDVAQKQVTFSWDNPEVTFADVVEAAGQVPLPPYLKRSANQEDKTRYQTVYSRQQGAVAAPTAGLHFTEEVLATLRQRGIPLDYLTLHVGAGTFQPIKEAIVQDHAMHSEQMAVTRENLRNLLQARRVVAVGTTTLRTLESLYWYGVGLLKKQQQHFQVQKLTPYQYVKKDLPTASDALKAVLNHMERQEKQEIFGTTEIFIFPGYRFRVCSGLVTNFHMPQSTLILLIAAFVGEDWRKIYRYALDHDYRFLSYGDSSLLLPEK